MKPRPTCQLRAPPPPDPSPHLVDVRHFRGVECEQCLLQGPVVLVKVRRGQLDGGHLVAGAGVGQGGKGQGVGQVWPLRYRQGQQARW